MMRVATRKMAALARSALVAAGYRVRVIDHAAKSDIETALTVLATEAFVFIGHGEASFLIDVNHENIQEWEMLEWLGARGDRSPRTLAVLWLFACRAGNMHGFPARNFFGVTDDLFFTWLSFDHRIRRHIENYRQIP